MDHEGHTADRPDQNRVAVAVGGDLHLTAGRLNGGFIQRKGRIHRVRQNKLTVADGNGVIDRLAEAFGIVGSEVVALTADSGHDLFGLIGDDAAGDGMEHTVDVRASRLDGLCLGIAIIRHIRGEVLVALMRRAIGNQNDGGIASGVALHQLLRLGKTQRDVRQGLIVRDAPDIVLRLIRRREPAGIETVGFAVAGKGHLAVIAGGGHQLLADVQQLGLHIVELGILVSVRIADDGHGVRAVQHKDKVHLLGHRVIGLDLHIGHRAVLVSPFGLLGQLRVAVVDSAVIRAGTGGGPAIGGDGVNTVRLFQLELSVQNSAHTIRPVLNHIGEDVAVLQLCIIADDQLRDTRAAAESVIPDILHIAQIKLSLERLAVAEIAVINKGYLREVHHQLGRLRHAAAAKDTPQLCAGDDDLLQGGAACEHVLFQFHFTIQHRTLQRSAAPECSIGKVGIALDDNFRQTGATGKSGSFNLFYILQRQAGQTYIIAKGQLSDGSAGDAHRLQPIVTGLQRFIRQKGERLRTYLAVRHLQGRGQIVRIAERIISHLAAVENQVIGNITPRKASHQVAGHIHLIHGQCSIRLPPGTVKDSIIIGLVVINILSKPKLTAGNGHIFKSHFVKCTAADSAAVNDGEVQVGRFQILEGIVLQIAAVLQGKLGQLVCGADTVYPQVASAECSRLQLLAAHHRACGHLAVHKCHIRQVAQVIQNILSHVDALSIGRSDVSRICLPRVSRAGRAGIIAGIRR